MDVAQTEKLGGGEGGSMCPGAPPVPTLMKLYIQLCMTAIGMITRLMSQ